MKYLMLWSRSGYVREHCDPRRRHTETDVFSLEAAPPPQGCTSPRVTRRLLRRRPLARRGHAPYCGEAAGCHGVAADTVPLHSSRAEAAGALFAGASPGRGTH